MTEPWEALCAKPALPRRPGLLLAALGAATAVVLAAMFLAATSEPPCAGYARRAAERRGLSRDERAIVARSCSVSKIYQPFRTRAEAEGGRETLKGAKRCASPGPYVARALGDESNWAVFCPMIGGRS